MQKLKVGLTSSPNTLRATLAEHLIAHVPNMLLLFAIPCPLAAGGHILIAKRGDGWGIVKVPKIWAGTALKTLYWRSSLRSILDRLRVELPSTACKRTVPALVGLQRTRAIAIP